MVSIYDQYDSPYREWIKAIDNSIDLWLAANEEADVVHLRTLRQDLAYQDAAANVVAERLRQLEWEEDQRAIEDWTND